MKFVADVVAVVPVVFTPVVPDVPVVVFTPVVPDVPVVDVVVCTPVVPVVTPAVVLDVNVPGTDQQWTQHEVLSH